MQIGRQPFVVLDANPTTTAAPRDTAGGRGGRWGGGAGTTPLGRVSFYLQTH